MHDHTHARQRIPIVLSAFSCLLGTGVTQAGSSDGPATRFRVPPGFVVEKVAGPPLVHYPMLAAFDDRGRLFVAEGTGTNLPGHELVKIKRGRITRLEDTDGDGRFDASTVFADGLIFPSGVLWHDGALYATSHPSLWRFEDTDDDGVADRREALVSEFGFNGNGCDIHGPFLGPDGWLYWTDGRHGHKVQTREGTDLEGLAARIWRCRPDGSQIERICGGGFDNPVEIIFTPEGELIGTMDQGPGDALLHYVEGGVYPREHPCLKEFPMTGPLLGAVSQYTAALPVALSGFCRYRSAAFGPAYQGTLFTAQFNVHRIQQHVLIPDGATFRSVDKDFLVSPDYDFHPSDVLEDADGSLLVVDMGAWFNFGCPTSKIAKPEVKGAIYRVRRVDGAPVGDPWGRQLNLAGMTPAALTALLDDPRPKVRDRVIVQLSKFGARAVPALTTVCQPHAEGARPSVAARRNALWALSRMGTSASKRAVRRALADPEASLRQVAAHCVGLERDQAAMEELKTMVVGDEPALRRKAAEALGRLGLADAVPALLDSLRRGAGDRFLEHALVYALIRIGDRTATLAALNEANPQVRRAGLIALDQMDGGGLTRELVVPLLDTDDPDLQHAALEIIGRHEAWSDHTQRLLGDWLRSDVALGDRQQRSLTGALLAFCENARIQRLVADALSARATPTKRRVLLLRVVARCRLEKLPAPWLRALGLALSDPDVAVKHAAVAAIRARDLSAFDQQLTQLRGQDTLPVDVRIAALGAMAARRTRLAPESFTLLTTHLSPDTPPLLRMAAARAVGAGALEDEQRLALAEHVTTAGPLLVPLLVSGFAGSSRSDVGMALAAALTKSPGAGALSPDALHELLERYPDQVRAAARPVLDRSAARDAEKEEYLAEVTLQLLQMPGDAARGRNVFFSRKVGCYACHRMEGQGGTAGPDLSRIGRIRGPRDLLEAILFPSASMADDFRPYAIATTAGQVVTGIIVRETADAVYLRTADRAEVRIARGAVEAVRQSTVSIMPQGLEKTMTPQELSDLLEFLYHRR